MAKRILVPLDQTLENEEAVEMVGDAARTSGATVRLLHVAPMPESVLDVDGRIIAYADQEAVRLESEAMDYLRTVEARLDGVPVECSVRFGDPVDEILLEADAFGADLIALTSRCPHRLARLVLTNTADQVCRKTDVPVVVFRPGRGGLW